MSIYQNILGDSVITWRCYAVWGGNLWVISLPVLMIIGTASMSLPANLYTDFNSLIFVIISRRLRCNSPVFPLAPIANNISELGDGHVQYFARNEYDRYRPHGR